jgi:hypothetical protein
MKKVEEKRRSFLKHILTGAAVVAGTVAAIQPARAKTLQQPLQGERDVLYHESDAFKKYYDSLRS